MEGGDTGVKEDSWDGSRVISVGFIRNNQVPMKRQIPDITGRFVNECL